jgi:hypothetical protein
VAQLTKFGHNVAVDGNGAAWDRLTEILESGFSLGDASFDRDEFYQR